MTADVPVHLHKLLRRAMDLTQPAIEHLLGHLQTHLIFFDFAPWLPALARRFNVKSVHYCTISPAAVAYMIREEASADAFLEPPPSFPSSSPIKLSQHEARALHEVNNGREFDSATTFVQRMLACLNECDGLGFKSCREIEGKYCEFVERKFKKPVLLAGVVVGGAGAEGVDEEKWRTWLGEFEAKSVVYCSFGSEARLSKKHFEEVVLGLELSGFPYLAALKAPEGGAVGSSRGVVVDEWVQQRMILGHASVGCFVTHCGAGSVREGMVAVLHAGDQVINARLVAGELRVARAGGGAQGCDAHGRGETESCRVFVGRRRPSGFLHGCFSYGSASASQLITHHYLQFFASSLYLILSCLPK